MSQFRPDNKDIPGEKTEDEASRLWNKYQKKDAKKEIAVKAWVVIGIIAVVVLMFIGLWIVAFK